MKRLVVIFAASFLALWLLAPLGVQAQSQPAGTPKINDCIDGEEQFTGTSGACIDTAQAKTANLCADNKGIVTAYQDNKGACKTGKAFRQGQTVAQVFGAISNPPDDKRPTPTPVTSTAVNCDTTYNDVRNGLCIPKNPTCESGNKTSIACSGDINITQLIAKIIDYLLYFAGIIAVVFVIIGGYKYMTSAGSDDQAKSGRKTLQNALIGLVIVILAYVLVNVVVNFLTK